MPAAYKNAKVKEFTNLREGAMSVAEYEVKFDQLSRYALHLVATEQDKCNKFEDGLRLEIKKGISTRDMHTFADLREAALRVERLMEEELSLVPEETGLSKGLGKRKGGFSATSGPGKMRGSSFKGGSQTKVGGSRQGSSAQRPKCDNCGKRHDGECWYLKQEQTVMQRPQCVHCGKKHEGECRLFTGACFGCGEQGHQLRQCPHRHDRGEEDMVPMA